MLNNLFKSKKKEVKATKNAKVEKLNTKELGNVVGGDGTVDVASGVVAGKRTHQPA
jgi:hypothetical protein